MALQQGPFRLWIKSLRDSQSDLVTLLIAFSRNNCHITPINELHIFVLSESQAHFFVFASCWSKKKKLFSFPANSAKVTFRLAAPSGGLTGVEIHGFLLLGVISGVRVAAVFPIIVHHKHSKQDDGNKLQNQGQDGELQPHVGGVGRHLVLVISGRLTHTHTHSRAHSSF